jgi:formate dehydrogenase iron-sulfur subunit
MLQGKLPLCAEMCSTKSLLAGDGEIIAQIYKERVIKRGYGSGSGDYIKFSFIMMRTYLKIV